MKLQLLGHAMKLNGYHQIGEDHASKLQKIIQAKKIQAPFS
jgi:hypothetical protein